MCGLLSAQKVLSGEVAARTFFVRPPEPVPQLLVSSPAESIYIGKTKLLKVPFFWNPAKLINPHLCIVGITGSGKSYFVKAFTTRARLVFNANILILDWAGEYVEWVRLAGGKVISFGENGINLLDPGQATPEIRMRQVISALEMLTDLASFPSQRSLTEEAIEKAYLQRGLSLNKAGQQKKPPTLAEVHAILKKDAKRSQAASEAARRVNSLLLSSGKSFSHSTIGIDSILSGLVCIDLHSLPTESLRSLAGLTILQFIKDRMRSEQFQAEGRPRLFVVVDEAWKIASDERSDVISIVREGRKYGFGLIIASQNPTDIHKSIFSNAGTTFIFRLTLASEREYLRSSLSYSDYYEEASHSMGVGQALVHIEPAAAIPCPRNFIIDKVDGEPLLEVCYICGGGMNLEMEKEFLVRKLHNFGLTERQVAHLLGRFERGSFTLDAPTFILELEKFGHSRAAIIMLLRDLGAHEKDLLRLFSSAFQKGKAKISVELSTEKEKEKSRRQKNKP
ncbi:MAG: ATP-binding protein [Candidatus Micrarchaeota archaeon]|nr:ATP-binding protein [Candidatus Micrarchaeota archaeon]